MIQLLTALLLGLLTILDPCTLMTSITAIGFIDREIGNRRRVLLCGGMFVLGKLATYILLSIPFLMGAQTQHIQHLLEHWGEPILAIVMTLCGIILFFAGHHHHEHDHGISRWLKEVDDEQSSFWAFLLGIFFAIAFCPHRLVYFITMIDISLTLSTAWNWLMPVVFGLGTGLPIMIIAWLISYSAVSIDSLRSRMSHIEKGMRYVCAALFLAVGLYMGAHVLSHHHGDGCDCGHEHCHHEHTELSI